MLISEPPSIAGAIAPLVDPAGFVTSQLGHIPAHPLYETERVLSLQLGNLYFLLAMMSIVLLNTTTEPRVVHGYLVVLAIADVGHVFATYAVMGTEAFMDVGSWNVMTWGNVGATIVLFTCRSSYLLGLFGPDRVGGTKTAVGWKKR